MLSAPLLVALALATGILAFAAVRHFAVPDLETAVAELADGDLDGPERAAMLRVVVDRAAAGSTPRELWAGWLAAIALDDAPAADRLRQQLGGGRFPTVVPPPAARRFLDLGDPVLANFAAGAFAEAANDHPAAVVFWRRVVAEGRLAPRPLATALAQAALQ
ncbi:MAG: hypothetical protein KDE27_24875 [Planctomycetes bacterium]|nr:hypothetical protein [Planctomycetota bacterium]